MLSLCLEALGDALAPLLLPEVAIPFGAALALLAVALWIVVR